jgi:hypothetical protein
VHALPPRQRVRRVSYMPKQLLEDIPFSVFVEMGRYAYRPRIGRLTQADRRAVDAALTRLNVRDRAEHTSPCCPVASASGLPCALYGPVEPRVAAREYFLQTKDELWAAVVESYQYLTDRFEILVIEGAGSPVELNLKPRDIANMRVAELADAAVALVVDIDRGGVFASVVGTLQLLEPHGRERVKGVIVNRFRDNPSLFADGCWRSVRVCPCWVWCRT